MGVGSAEEGREEWEAKVAGDPRIIASLARIEPIQDIGALGRRWRALEASCNGGFFRSWTYLGCLAEERFAGASLLSVTQGGQDQALALLGQRRGRWFLNETGDPAQDAPFIEHNGLLHRPGAEALLSVALRQATARGRPLVLSGIGGAHLRAARRAGWVSLQRTRPSPAIDLSALDQPFIETLSANARGQIRRAQRLYGPNLLLRRAPTLDDALGVFEQLVHLHQARWTARGKQGAFADPAMLRFHRALIARAHPTGEADLLEIRADERLIGALYTFIGNGKVALSYQSGFAYSQDARDKPGLVCHTLAIEHYARRGLRLYDLLGGEDRYKKTLAGGEQSAGEALHWVTLRRWSSPAGLMGAAAARLRSRLSAWRGG